MRRGVRIPCPASWDNGCNCIDEQGHAGQHIGSDGWQFNASDLGFRLREVSPSSDRKALLTLVWQRLIDRRSELYAKAAEGCSMLDILRDVLNQAEQDFNNGMRATSTLEANESAGRLPG